ncbi:MAG: sulfotransferase [Alphaproteobacteria bacterium]|nr:MAG: sulfotransferase [Alphaproteobacteria bacterium]
MKPVFLIGSGRSGTTFIQRVFDSHPDTLCLHEPDSIRRTTNPPFTPFEEDYDDLKEATAHYVAELMTVRGLRAVSKRPFFRKSYRGPVREALRACVLTAMNGLDVTLGRIVNMSATPVPDFADTSGVMTVLKSVECLSRLPLIARACPDVQVVHILRHPCGFVASQLRGRELGKMPQRQMFPERLKLPIARKHGLTVEKLEAMEPVERMAWGWTISNDTALTLSEGLPNVQRLVYDALCDNLLRDARALLEGCGLEWHRQVEEFLEFILGQGQDNREYFSVVRNPRDAAHHWRETMPKDQVDKIMAIATLSPAGRIFADYDRTFSHAPSSTPNSEHEKSA